MTDEVIEKRIDYIMAIVNELEKEDTIEWGLLNISEDTALRMIALNVIEHFNKYTTEERDIMIATITKLVVDNFILNLKLQQQGK